MAAQIWRNCSIENGLCGIKSVEYLPEKMKVFFMYGKWFYKSIPIQIINHRWSHHVESEENSTMKSEEDCKRTVCFGLSPKMIVRKFWHYSYGLSDITNLLGSYVYHCQVVQTCKKLLWRSGTILMKRWWRILHFIWEGINGYSHAKEKKFWIGKIYKILAINIIVNL